MIKTLIASLLRSSPLLLSVLSLAAVVPAIAQSAPPRDLPPVPTIKVLAIGHIVAANAGSRQAIMSAEVTETVKLYLAGKIDQWFVRKDQPGVVFLMNVATVKEAHDLLEALPLGRAGVMEFDLIPLGPLSPLQYLIGPPARP